MFKAFLIFISTLIVVLGGGCPSKVSNTPLFVIMLEHLGVLALSYLIIKRQFVGTFKRFRERYYTFFLFGYSISLVLLVYLWIPYLVENYSLGWSAFDPVKYYAMACEMAKGYTLSSIADFPVALIFFFEMLIMGIHPIVPFFVNQIVFLYAVLILVKYLNRNSAKNIPSYSWLLLIPEILYFNITSSKDIICMLCATIIFVQTQKIWQKDYKLSTIISAVFFFVVMFFARTSMAMMAALAVVIFYMDLKKISFKNLTFLLICIVAFVISLRLTESMDVSTTVADLNTKSAEYVGGNMTNAAKLADQSGDAFARRLIPHNSFEFIVFGIVRSIIYAFISPTDFMNLFDFRSLNLNYTSYLTSLLMTFAWPFFIYLVIKKRKCIDKELKNLLIVTMIYVFIVGMFNPMMIHRRYRVVYDLLFFALYIKSWLVASNKENFKIGKLR